MSRVRKIVNFMTKHASKRSKPNDEDDCDASYDKNSCNACIQQSDKLKDLLQTCIKIYKNNLLKTIMCFIIYCKKKSTIPI